MSRVAEPGTDAVVEEVLRRYPRERSSLIAVLQDLNRELRYLPEETLRRVASGLQVPLSQVYHVATFYSAFALKPRGKHTVKVCMGTACHVRGAPRILDEISRRLGIGSGETTADGEFTLETVNCLGACALGPIMVVDKKYHGRMSTNKIEGVLKQYP